MEIFGEDAGASVAATTAAKMAGVMLNLTGDHHDGGLYLEASAGGGGEPLGVGSGLGVRVRVRLSLGLRVRAPLGGVVAVVDAGSGHVGPEGVAGAPDAHEVGFRRQVGVVRRRRQRRRWHELRLHVRFAGDLGVSATEGEGFEIFYLWHGAESVEENDEGRKRRRYGTW